MCVCVRVQDGFVAALGCRAIDPGHDAEDQMGNLPHPLGFDVYLLQDVTGVVSSKHMGYNTCQKKPL